MNAETEKKAERILTDLDFAARHLPSLSEDLTEIKRDSLKLVRKLDQLVNMSEFSGRMRDKRTGLLGGPVPTDTGCGVIRLNHVFPRLLLFCGCGTTPAVPEDGCHQLEPMPPSVPVPQPVFPQELQVASASADPLRGRRAVLYRESGKPPEVKRYQYRLWVDRPPRMAHQANGVTCVPAVFLIRLVAGAARQAGLSLRAHLKRFDRLIGAGSPKLEIELEATVYADGARQPLWTKSYFHHQGSDAGNLRATAAAIQAALANMLYSMVEDPAEKDLTP